MLINKVVQNKAIMSGTSNQDMNDVACYDCHKKGHIKVNCPEVSSAGFQSPAGIPLKTIKPGEVESHIKTRNGRTWKWCKHYGNWRAGHNSHLMAEHVPRGRMNAANVPQETKLKL